jgi:hypothetical protein
VYHVRFKSRLFRHFTLQQKLDGTETRAPLPPDPAPLVVLKLSSTRAQQLVLMDKSRATDEELDFLGPRRRGRRFCCARSSARWATTMQLDAFNKVRTLAGDVLHAFLDLYPCARRRSGSSSSARALPRGPASPPAATRDPGGAARRNAALGRIEQHRVPLASSTSPARTGCAPLTSSTSSAA